jgi:hypothetical protein
LNTATNFRNGLIGQPKANKDALFKKPIVIGLEINESLDQKAG